FRGWVSLGYMRPCSLCVRGSQANESEAAKSAPGSIDFLERSVALQPVSVGVEHVELPSAPRGVSWCLPPALTHSIEHSAVAKFGIQSVDLLDPNAVSRSIDGVSPLRLRLP